MIYHNIPYFHLKLMNDGITEMSHDFCICFMTGVPGIWAQYVLLLAKHSVQDHLSGSHLINI